MLKQLQLKFDPNQDYQIEAVQSVVDVFDGLPRYTTEFVLGDNVVPNLPAFQTLGEDWLYSNVRAVQERNNIQPRISELAVDEGLVLEGAGDESWRYPSFTVEMETGTGKTYVYLRTIHELHKRYGFRKFIVVVPSIAIYEGFAKNFEITRSHFAALYGNEPVNLIRYDGSKLSALRGFATSTFVEIMVMTIQSFNTAKGRSSNRIFGFSEQLPGERLPYQYVQETRPILILDEPQNMESKLAREALRTLHPLFALRYSATHRETPNLLYQLTPFEAYQRGLVKRIQVDGVTERQSFNEAFLALRGIEINNKQPIARVQTLATDNGQTREVTIELKHGDNLYTKTKRDEYQHGYVVTEINARDGFVEFDGGVTLRISDMFGNSKQAIFRVQIERTIERHMQVQEELLDKGVKVLSLFFIDRVANYVNENGIIRCLFDEAFERLKGKFPFFANHQAHEVRSAYFATRKTKEGEEAIDTESRTKDEREAEKAAFELIMRDKERLLSLDEPVSFIFAHSALKEGWDNPNVFQICTLNQTVSEMKKRQEIGRGLRLPVNQDGERIFDEDVNVLTVVANESYETYAATLQNEYREAGQAAPPPPSRVDKAVAVRNEEIFNKPEFRDFWEKLSRLTRYRINIDTPELIHECVLQFNSIDDQQLKPQIVIERGRFVVTRFTLTLEAVESGSAQIRIQTQSTDDVGKPNTLLDMSVRPYKARENLGDKNNEPRLRMFRVREIVEAGEKSYVTFENDVKLYLGEQYQFDSEKGQVPQERLVFAPEQTYPVFNLIDRAAKETGLTRPTINEIFRRIDGQKKQYIFRNPEGFASVFISILKNALADHIADRIEFVLEQDGDNAYDLEQLFPLKKQFPQKELIVAGPFGLYDQVQIDSDVEKRFAEKHLTGDDRRVIAYFKFPSAFRISFPKILGNYNPDWGILRLDQEDRVVLQLVRETKGSEDPEKLQFSHEKRKVKVAKKHFQTIGIDYRVVTDQTPQWWEPESRQTASQTLFDSIDNATD